jgi:hypothetical protein
MGGGLHVAVSRYHHASKALNSIELDLVYLVSKDVTRVHPRVRFCNNPAARGARLCAHVVNWVRRRNGRVSSRFLLGQELGNVLDEPL